MSRILKMFFFQILKRQVLRFKIVWLYNSSDWSGLRLGSHCISPAEHFMKDPRSCHNHTQQTVALLWGNISPVVSDQCQADLL